MSKPRCIIFDMDGCLCHNTPGFRLNWEDVDYCTGIMRDAAPNLPVVELMKALLTLNLVVLVMTGRPESYRKVTRDWLIQNRIMPQNLWMRANTDIWMRPDGDMRSDAEAKREHLAIIMQTHDIWFVVEDRISVVAMWRAEGVTCLQCAEGNY